MRHIHSHGNHHSWEFLIALGILGIVMGIVALIGAKREAKRLREAISTELPKATAIKM